MKIEIKCFATLSCRQPGAGSMELQDGAKVADLIKALDLPAEDVQIIMLNGRHCQPETQLKDGDRVGLFPAVGGG